MQLMSMTIIRGLEPPPSNLAPRVAPVASLVSPLGPLHQRTGGPYHTGEFQGHPTNPPNRAWKDVQQPELQPAEQHGREMEVTHRLSNSQSHTASSKAQSALQIADKLVSPGSILFSQRNRPPGLRPSHVRAVSDDMDRRHPSSFQQLEKVCIHWTYLTES
jgi:hypothetical protein